MEKSTYLGNSTAITNKFENDRYKHINEKLAELKKSYLLT